MEGGSHFYLVHPLKEFNVKTIIHLSDRLCQLSGKPVFVKKISEEQSQKLLASKFLSIENYPWHGEAVAEDDTKPGQILDIKKTIQKYDNHTGKRRRDMEKVCEGMRVEPITRWNTGEAIGIVNEFLFNGAKGHLSKPSDYYNMIFCPQRLGEFLALHACREWQKAGGKLLHLGGSETKGLFEFKEKFEPMKHEEGYWVVYGGSR